MPCLQCGMVECTLFQRTDLAASAWASLLAARRENVGRQTSSTAIAAALPTLSAPHRTIPHRPPFASAAYAGHAVLKQLFPWRFSSLDKAIKPLVADLTEEQRTAAEQVGRDAAIEVLTAR